MTPFRGSPMACCLEEFLPPTSILPRDPAGSMQGTVSFGGGGGAQSTQSSAHRIKISAIRNPIPEPPPVMKATLSLRKKEAL